MCIQFFVLFRLDSNDDGDDDNFFVLEAFLQVPIHFQVNKYSKKKNTNIQLFTKGKIKSHMRDRATSLSFI